MDSPGSRVNASISVMLARRLSSSRSANRACNDPNKYVTGSTATPFTTPPVVISCGVTMRAISRAAPPRRMMMAAHCWYGCRSVSMIHMAMSVM